MAALRQDLRDHLTAVIEAAQELPREDRSYLADSFLDELERQYQLVPRDAGARRSEPSPARPRFAGFPFGRSAAPIGLILLSLLFLPVVVLSFFVLVHPPVFLFVVLLLVLFRFGRPGWRRGGPWRYGSRGGGMAHYL